MMSNILRKFRKRYKDDDDRFDRTFLGFKHGDHVKITGGSNKGQSGRIGFIHKSSDGLPKATIVTSDDEKVICGAIYLEMVKDNASKQQSSINLPTKVNPEIVHDNNDDVEDCLDKLSLQVAAMTLMSDDPKQSWETFKRNTDNLMQKKK